jgi:hypothetical protein
VKQKGREAKMTKEPKPGEIAGELGNQGYWEIEIDGQVFRRCEIVWALHMHWPQGVIEHINGNLIDDRFENLREVKAH